MVVAREEDAHLSCGSGSSAASEPRPLGTPSSSSAYAKSASSLERNCACAVRHDDHSSRGGGWSLELL